MGRKNKKKKRDKQKIEKDRVKFKRLDLLILLIILLISGFLRIYGLSFPHKVYFDETHYVPAARSYLQPDKLDPNDIHPPLAKEIMAIFIHFYGDYSIGWRAGSVFFGLLMIVVMYLFGLYFFKSRLSAVIASSLLGIEFLHIVQSRIATLDIYLAFFILGGYYFAWKYYDNKPANGEGSRPFIYIIISAAFFGLATSVKLSGLGGAAGAFLFLAIALLREDDRRKYLKLISIAVAFACVIILVYLATHVPLFLKGLKFKKILYIKTFKFHYTDEFKHPYLSQMWQWPTMHRPIWYYWDKNEQTGIIRGIIAMGSLLFWWSFLIVLADMLYRAFKEKDLKIIFILCGYLPLYLFWLSSLSNYGGTWHFKGGFFYYMLPCVPFMCLGLTETINDLMDTKLGRVTVWVYFLGLLIFLAAYYPILTGIPITGEYFEKLMRLNIFNSWT